MAAILYHMTSKLLKDHEMYKFSTYNSITPKHKGDIKLSNNFDLIKVISYGTVP